MCHASHQLYPARRGQIFVGLISIGLKVTGKIFKKFFRAFPATGFPVIENSHFPALLSLPCVEGAVAVPREGVSFSIKKHTLCRIPRNKPFTFLTKKHTPELGKLVLEQINFSFEA